MRLSSEQKAKFLNAVNNGCSGEDIMAAMGIKKSLHLKGLFCDFQTAGCIAPDKTLWWRREDKKIDGKKAYRLRVMSNGSVQVSAKRLKFLGLSFLPGAEIAVRKEGDGLFISLTQTTTPEPA